MYSLLFIYFLMDSYLYIQSIIIYWIRYVHVKIISGIVKGGPLEHLYSFDMSPSLAEQIFAF